MTIDNSEVTLKEADENQSSLLVEIRNFKHKTKPQVPEKKQKKKDVFRNSFALFDGRERVLDAFESKIFSIKRKVTGFSNFSHSKLKILTPKPMLKDDQ